VSGGGLVTAQAGRLRGRIRPDRVYVGWRQASPGGDPGHPPELPVLPATAQVTADWMAAQQREYRRLARPAWLAGAGSAAAAAALLVAGPGALVSVPAACALAIAAAAAGRRAWQAERALTARINAEAARVTAFAGLQQREIAARQDEHGRRYREWQRRAAAYRRLPQWYPVTLPATVHRLDIAGGTLAGWSALLTMLGAARLAAGGEVTVLDLTEGGVAADLVAVARRTALDPIVWVLPQDLPRLELGAQLGPPELADVLAQTAAAADGPAQASGRMADPPGDAALISCILEVLGDRGAEPGPLPAIIAALRCVGQLSMPVTTAPVTNVPVTNVPVTNGEAPSVLTADQIARLATLAGRSAGHLAVERSWALEARLRALQTLATDLTSRPQSRLRVAWLDRRSAATGNGVLAAYLAIALTAVLRQAPAAPRWRQTVVVLGAQRLPGDVLDRLCDAAEIAGAGLVLAYRGIPQHVRERLGRGDAAVGFMRLGNAEDARLAAEQIGTEHRFVISQLTDTVSASVTDTIGVSYTSSAGTSDSLTDSSSLTASIGRSQGRGRSRHGTFAPFADFTGSASSDRNSAQSLSDGRSIAAGISTGTSWGWSTSRAAGTSDSFGRTAQRSRESVVEQHELQQLPQSAVLLSYPSAGANRVVLADANPAIMTLPEATLASPPEAGLAGCPP
jgi:hypothetical protein